MKRAAVVLLGAALAMAAAPLASGQGPVRVTVFESWFIHNESMGDVIAVEKGYYKGAGLDVEVVAGGPGLSPIERTMAKAREGAVALGVDYPQNILEARTKQKLPLVVIAHDFQHSAMRIVCWTPKTRPSDFTGAFATWIGYDKPIKSVVGKEGQQRLQVINQTGDPATLGGWLARQSDCASAMIYNELLIIEKMQKDGKIKDPVYVYTYPGFGVDWPENVLFTTDEVVAKHAAQVQKFVTNRYRGYDWGFANRAAAAQFLKKWNKNLDAAHEVEGMGPIQTIMVTADSRANGLGYVDPRAWQRMVRDLVRGGFYTAPPAYQKAYTTAFPSGVKPK